MAFSEADAKILSHLCIDWRTNTSKLAKSLKLTRRQVEYRLLKLEKSGAIRGYVTYFNTARLGFPLQSVLFLQIARSHYKACSSLLKGTSRCVSWGKSQTKYDIFSNWVFKDKKDLNEVVNKLKSQPWIKKIDIVIPSFIGIYPLKIVHDAKLDSIDLTTNATVIQLSQTEKRVLQILAQNGRMSIVDIARKAFINPVTCLYMLRRLKKDGVILGTRIQFSLKSIGMMAMCFFIKSNQNQEKLKQYAAQAPWINLFIAAHNLSIIQIFHKDQEIITSTLHEIHTVMQGAEYTIESSIIDDDEELVNTIPFLNSI